MFRIQMLMYKVKRDIEIELNEDLQLGTEKNITIYKIIYKL